MDESICACDLGKNVMYVLEANPNPDIGFDSGFVRSSEASGRTHTAWFSKS